jgi:predicted nucleic acid-binding Zn ribbon protein
LPANAADYAGWYEPAAPRNEFIHFLERLLGMSRVRFAGGNLLLTNLGMVDQPFIPVSGAQFRYLPKKDHPEPVATAILLKPNAEGRFVFLGGTMKRIPTALALGQIALTAWFVLAFLAVLLYAPFWTLGGLIEKRRRPAERAMRLWPLIAVLSLLGFVVLFMVSSNDAIARLGNLTFWSFGIFLATLLFAFATLASVVALWRSRKRQIRASVRWFSILATSALLIAAIYLAFWGVIGMRTWA